jgi:F0F1-type ATP synthase assembly protein I
VSAEDLARERRARVLGVATALVAMAAASWWIRWPAPGVSAALGLAVYWIARGRRD